MFEILGYIKEPAEGSTLHVFENEFVIINGVRFLVRLFGRI